MPKTLKLVHAINSMLKVVALTDGNWAKQCLVTIIIHQSVLMFMLTIIIIYYYFIILKIITYMCMYACIVKDKHCNVYRGMMTDLIVIKTFFFFFNRM